MQIRVYLGGHMTGLTREEMIVWRRHAKQVLEREEFIVLDPTRGQLLENIREDVIDENSHTVFVRDRFDVIRSDILLINVKDHIKVTIGSVMELAWANLSNTFVVLVMEREGNPHMHSFVRECAGIIFDDLDEALDYIVATFQE